ncbi:hypothetical protein BMW26_14375 [Microbacterium sp. 1.5R]|nr:hypothetical protein BMW26_14375 [Microbacterium sp. 1.5R]
MVIDAAASVFARHGLARTSLQSIADATGYSKAGLIHHFASKQAIFDATVDECRGELGRIIDRVLPVAQGDERDRYAIELLVDLALTRPGLVTLIVSGSTPLGADNGTPVFAAITDPLFRAFGVTPESSSPTRYIEVVGALAALSVLALNAHQLDEVTAWRADIVRTSLAALGHCA